jgi:hypothetical protein
MEVRSKPERRKVDKVLTVISMENKSAFSKA